MPTMNHRDPRATSELWSVGKEVLIRRERLSFSWHNKQTDHERQHSFMLFLLCSCVADPATSLTSNSVLGTLFSSENSWGGKHFLLFVPPSYKSVNIQVWEFELHLQNYVGPLFKCPSQKYKLVSWTWIHINREYEGLRDSLSLEAATWKSLMPICPWKQHNGKNLHWP